MNSLVIEGVKPWDGRYEFDIADSELTTREWGWIKRLVGYMPLTIEEGFSGGDPELYACFAAIALRRAGKIDNDEVKDVFDRFADVPFGATIRLESDGATAADADPPRTKSSNGNTLSSGDDSTKNSETSVAPPSASGTPASATSALAPARSGS